MLFEIMRHCSHKNTDDGLSSTYSVVRGVAYAPSSGRSSWYRQAGRGPLRLGWNGRWNEHVRGIRYVGDALFLLIREPYVFRNGRCHFNPWHGGCGGRCKWWLGCGVWGRGAASSIALLFVQGCMRCIAATMNLDSSDIWSFFCALSYCCTVFSERHHIDPQWSVSTDSFSLYSTATTSVWLTLDCLWKVHSLRHNALCSKIDDFELLQLRLRSGLNANG